MSEYNNSSRPRFRASMKFPKSGYVGNTHAKGYSGFGLFNPNGPLMLATKHLYLFPSFPNLSSHLGGSSLLITLYA